ncbi:hypothetical protein [Methylobacterium fujisawaense]|uniref:hypothetical protein n=1 Tax=Methylobacterium fujisawaense TaxID=107400 RepID=UPI002F35452D
MNELTMTGWEKAGVWAAIVSAGAAVLALGWSYHTKPAPASGPTINTIKVVDAVYTSFWHPDDKHRGSIYNHLHDQCDYKASCQYACDNKRSGAGDVSKGDTSKHCIIHYTCSKNTGDLITDTVAEDEKGLHPLACEQRKCWLGVFCG